MTSITLSGVNKSFGANFPVIRDVDLAIDDGEFCVFLGPSGCGKSTLLRMVAGLEMAYSGAIRIGERAVAKGVTEVTFDRGGFIYHGRVQALADGARNAGRQF